MSASICTVEVGPSVVIVAIGKVPHLILRRSDIGAIQGWIWNIGYRAPYYTIEITTSRGVVTADYADRSLWEEILRELADERIFDKMHGE